MASGSNHTNDLTPEALMTAANESIQAMTKIVEGWAAQYYSAYSTYQTDFYDDTDDPSRVVYKAQYKLANTLGDHSKLVSGRFKEHRDSLRRCIRQLTSLQAETGRSDIAIPQDPTSVPEPFSAKTLSSQPPPTELQWVYSDEEPFNLGLHVSNPAFQNLRYNSSGQNQQLSLDEVAQAYQYHMPPPGPPEITSPVPSLPPTDSATTRGPFSPQQTTASRRTSNANSAADAQQGTPFNSGDLPHGRSSHFGGNVRSGGPAGQS